VTSVRRGQNFEVVTVVCDPSDYDGVLARLRSGELTSGAPRAGAEGVPAHRGVRCRLRPGWRGKVKSYLKDHLTAGCAVAALR
jgi:hypothetical protein